MIRTIDERAATWLRIVLDAPPGNLLTHALVRELRATLAGARGRRALKWLTIEGSGADFSFGASIPEHKPVDMPRVLRETDALLRDLLAWPSPTAALVSGRCLGGGFELALACDEILATGEATLGLPEVTLCAFAPAAAALLPPRVGTSRSARAMIAGEAYPATYWSDAGLVTLVTSETRLFDAAAAYFDRYLAPRSAVALSHTAEASRITLRAHAEPALAAAEAQYLDRLLRTSDAAEGVNAWMEKRAPRWSDA